MNFDELHSLHKDKLISSFGVSTHQSAFRDNKLARAFGNDSMRNENVGMFSGPKPSYQRFSASPAASDVIKKLT